MWGGFINEKFYSEYKLGVFNNVKQLISLNTTCKFWITFKTFVSYIYGKIKYFYQLCIFVKSSVMHVT